METLDAVTPAQWLEACRHCEQLVEEFLKSDGLQEIAMEQLVIEMNAESSDESPYQSSDEDL